MRLTKRKLLTGLSSLLGLAGIAPSFAAVHPTPRQTEGPFYPRSTDLFDDQDNDLVKIAGIVKQAGGEILHLTGHLTDRQSRSVPDALVEIWQCDVNGRYLHGADPATERSRDGAFQGYGFTETDGSGEFQFRTIKPVPYPGRTPHIHAKFHHPTTGSVLTTQFYLADEKGNQRDGLYSRLNSADRASLTMALKRDQTGDWQTNIKVVV